MSEQPEERLDGSGAHGVMVVQVGGRSYPAKSVAQCRTCRSKYRTEIEQAIINGLSYQAVVREAVEPFDDHSPIGAPNHDSILRHVQRKHMPIPYSLQRQLIEDRARQLGKSIETAEEVLADNVAIYRSVAQRGFERLNSGEIQPTMGDLLKVLQLQAAIEGGPQSGEATEDEWREALMEYMAIVQRNVSTEVFQRIGQEMASSPALEAIRLRRQQAIAGQIEQ